MINFILIALCIVAGSLFRRAGLLPTDAHKSINAWIIYLALPAVAFKWLPHVTWSSHLLVPALAPLAVWLCGWLFITLYARSAGLDKASAGGLKLVSGLSNCSFVGFPLVVAWFGENELGTAVICDQATFLILSTAGIVVAIHSAGKQTLSASVVLKKTIAFPPFLACISAIVLPQFIDLSPLEPLFNKLALTTAPLALFSIGLQLHLKGWQQSWKTIAAAAFYKLLLAPAIVLVVLLLLKIKGIIAEVTLFEIAMPSQLAAGVIAAEYDLNPRLTSLVIGVTILLSFATTAGWYWVITRLL